MPAAIKATIDGDNIDKLLTECERQSKEMHILTCFSTVPEDVAKNFPHTKRVGDYLVGRMINKGSFAKVMEGMHIPTGQKVALKVIDKKKAKQDSYVLKNMKREPRIHQMVKHPNLVQLYETLETENSYYMVMELCEGGDLMDRICDKKRLEEKEVRKYARQIMSAVDHLHRHGIVHRDLKIENFLLDENGNIKIVDLGLSNTIKCEGVSQDLLNTQCGSPAYAAPELLANKKYGPKVDVWSIGVSIYAMLTGTLPFTVEPFNIKQLHQKMVNLEINPFPRGVSTGAIHFIHTLLEPDPDKRPNVKEAMSNKWLNESFMQKHLSSVSYKNRLRPDELNSAVLSHMVSTMDIDITRITHVVINNKPSPITASYYLLLKRYLRKPCNQLFKNEDINEIHENDHIRSIENQNDVHLEEVTVQKEKKDAKLSKSPLLYEPIQEDEIAITLDNQENLVKGSTFAGREVVYLEPPDLSRQHTLESTSARLSPLSNKDLNQQEHNQENNMPHVQKEINHSKTNRSAKFQIQQTNSRSGLHIGKALTMPLRQVNEIPPPPKQATNLRDLLSEDGNILADCYYHQDGESHNLVIFEPSHQSTLPKLRNPMPRENFAKRISWVTSQQGKSGSVPIVIHGTRPPLFPMSRQKTIIVKSLGQAKEKQHLSIDKVKRNMVQLTPAHKSTNLNLPLLLPTYKKRSERKKSVLKLEFV